jgi:hypothetical membrane protein
MVKRFHFMFGIGSHGCFITGATMFDWWSLKTNVISDIGHLRSDLVGQPCQKLINISSRPFGAEL